MLTKTDLKQIQTIVRQEVTREGKTIRSDIRGEMKLLKMELSNRITQVEERLANIEIRLTNVEKDIFLIKKDIKKIKKDLIYSVDFLDREFLQLNRRVERIEERLNLPATAL